MATKCKDLGFSCAVITDHWYDRDDLTRYSMTYDKYLLAKKDAEDATNILQYPVIIGIEYTFFRCEEVLCFGSDFIEALYKGVDSIEDFIKLKEKHNGAAILCHPALNTFIDKGGHKAIDGYEVYNNRQYMFGWREIPKEFDELVGYSNSDAHCLQNLNLNYNLVEEDIKTEEQLVLFIRNKKKVDFFINK